VSGAGPAERARVAQRFDAARAAAHADRPHSPTAAVLPPCFFVVALAFFATALVTAPFVAGELSAHFYQSHVLALTHMLTVGWISMVIVGVLYRYVPAIAKQPLPFPPLAIAQALSFTGGAVALVIGFWHGDWTTTAVAATTLLGSAMLLGANLWPLVLRAPSHGVAEVGIALATGFLVAAATLGTLFAIDKQVPLLGGSLLTNLGAHAHLAAVGWVGITICALSFRFLPAFLMADVQMPDAARTQVLTLAVAVSVLALTLLTRSKMAVGAAVAVAGALLAYLVLLVRMMMSHRMPIDWTARHAAAAAAWLTASVVAACTLAWIGADDELGTRVATAYGAAGLLGWMSNLIIGMSYKLFPGFVAAARIDLGRRRVPVMELGVPEHAPAPIFVGFNLGVMLIAGGLLGGEVTVVTAGTVVTALAGLGYVGVMARTVAYTFVDPPPASDPLRIIN
jgi:hypothetical protein